MKNKKRDWLHEIYEELCDVRATYSDKKIVIQVSELMFDYLHLLLVESNEYMKATVEKNETDDSVAYLYGCELKINNNMGLNYLVTPVIYIEKEVAL